MSSVLPEVLQNRLDVLQQLGVAVDSVARDWLLDQTGSFDQSALNSIVEVRRMIELTVDLALTLDCTEAPPMLAMRQLWEDRFAKIGLAIKEKQARLSESAQKRTQQTRAAQAYLGTESLAGR